MAPTSTKRSLRSGCAPIAWRSGSNWPFGSTSVPDVDADSQASSRPSLSESCTVVLRIIALNDTQSGRRSGSIFTNAVLAFRGNLPVRFNVGVSHFAPSALMNGLVKLANGLDDDVLLTSTFSARNGRPSPTSIDRLAIGSASAELW